MGARARRTLPTIWVHRWSLSLVSCHSARGSGGQAVVMPGSYRNRRETAHRFALTSLSDAAKLRPRNAWGQVAEWLKAHAWRACLLLARSDPLDFASVVLP